MINSFHEGRGIFYAPPPPPIIFLYKQFTHKNLHMNIHYQVLFSLALIIAIAKNEGVRTLPPLP